MDNTDKEPKEETTWEPEYTPFPDTLERAFEERIKELTKEVEEKKKEQE